MALAVLELT